MAHQGVDGTDLGGLDVDGRSPPTMRNVPPIWAWTFGTAAVLTGITYCTLWLRGWLNRRQSLRMACFGSSLIAVGCVMQSYPMVA